MSAIYTWLRRDEHVSMAMDIAHDGFAFALTFAKPAAGKKTAAAKPAP